MKRLHGWLRSRCGGRTGQHGSWRSLRGAALMEMALFLPLMLVFGLACLQFAIIFTAYLNMVNVTRDAARWVTIHPHVIDASTVTTVKTRLPAAMTANALTLTFSPACGALSSGKCTGRTTGTRIEARATYTITSHLFLPASFGFGSIVVAIPTTLPSYSIFMQVEPS
jgi:Flp pilus assembly protein TadG